MLHFCLSVNDSLFTLFQFNVDFADTNIWEAETKMVRIEVVGDEGR